MTGISKAVTVWCAASLSFRTCFVNLEMLKQVQHDSVLAVVTCPHHENRALLCLDELYTHVIPAQAGI